MIVLIPWWLTPTEQGYYYTFASLIALQVFFELGMNQVIVQLVAHEVAQAERNSNGAMVRDPIALARLISLSRLLGRWYFVTSLLFGLAAGTGGIIFFMTQAGGASGMMLLIWIVLVLATAANLYLSPWLAVMEGMGEVGRVARLRLIQSVLGYGLTILALVSGARLGAVPALAIIGALCTSYWLSRREPMLRWLRREAATTDADATMLSWRRDIFPLQWRIAVSWISGYFIMQLFVPLTFVHWGAVEAGRLGMSLSIFNAVLTVGLSWVNTKLPVMSGQIARGEHRPLNTLFFGALARSMVAVVLGCIAVVLAYAILPATMRSRLADPSVMALLAVTTMLLCFTSALATYMRAHKEEPLLAASVTLAALSLAAAVFGSWFGVPVMMALYATILLVVSLPWILRIFLQYLSRHRPAA